VDDNQATFSGKFAEDCFMLTSTSLKIVTTVTLVVSLGLLFIGQLALQAAPIFTGCGGEIVAPTNLEYELRVIELVNARRAEQGLPPFKVSAELTNSARYHAVDMALDGYFDHDTYDLVDGALTSVCLWHQRIGHYYPITQAAENIAAGYSSPERVVGGWMNSPGHKRNILSNNWEIGVGFYEYHWVQDFSRRENIYPLIINREAASTQQPEVDLYLYGDEWQEMRLRNDGGEWGEWQPFQNQLAWRLMHTAGLRMVEAEMRNGSSTVVTSDTIELTTSGTPDVTPTVTDTPLTATPTPSETPTATSVPEPTGPAEVTGQVELEGRPTPPDERWVTPLLIQFLRRDPGPQQGQIYTFASQTNPAGSFQVQGLGPGIYTVTVKGEHTLQRIISLTVTSENNVLDVGLLPEGDAVEDNQINILDFSRLAGAYGRCTGDEQFVANADFDEDDCVRAGDYALLHQNFGLLGDELNDLSAVAASATPASFFLSPKVAGEQFTVTVRINHLAADKVDASALYLNFDAQRLQVIGLTPNPQLSTIVRQTIDNSQGRIDLAVGLLGGDIPPPFTLAQITFEALTEVASAQLVIETADVRRSELAWHGESLLDELPGGVSSAIGLSENLPSVVFLPLVQGEGE
jgi:uncharacterized protein YkwD